MKILASAIVERGAKTNRVRYRKPKRSFSPTNIGAARKAYKQDPEVRGKDYVLVAISLPVEELVAMDEFAERVQMARSHLIRQAVKHFRAKVLGDD